LRAHVDHDATVAAMIAPAVGGIAAADTGDVARLAVLDRHAVHVAAIFCRELADERRPPARHEAVELARDGDAAEQRVHEHRPSVSRRSAMSWMSRSPVVHADLRDVDAVVAVVRLAGASEFSKRQSWYSELMYRVWGVACSPMQRAKVRLKISSRPSCSNPIQNTLPTW
jgi:hypothetical protein